MAAEPKRIKVTPGSELAKLLEEAACGPLVIETDGQLYRLDRVEREPEDIWASYDAKAALEGIDAAAGSWSDLDPETVKDFIYRAREEGTRPAERP
jgi:hypothetical protein